MESKVKKHIAYIRVSTDKQDLSVQAQKEKLNAFFAYKNIENVEFFIDEDISGSVELFARPQGFLIHQLIKQRRIECIYATRLDRLFRSTIDGLSCLNELNKYKTDMVFIDLGGNVLDTKTAIGKMLFRQMLSAAEFEKDIIGERTSTVLQSKKMKSKVYCKNAPYGYKKINGDLVQCDNEMSVIALMQNYLSKGLSYGKIAKNLQLTNIKNRKGNDWDKSSIRSILQSNLRSTHSQQLL